MKLKHPFPGPVCADLMHDTNQTCRETIPLYRLLEINPFNNVSL
ncbi:MAG: hypothetical protein OJF50_002007 [Nitrospira sp.]|nr:hypothetical protein [Nitrospira sp.]